MVKLFGWTGLFGWRRSDELGPGISPCTKLLTPMRLSERKRSVIRQATAEVAGPLARVLLFGSRTRDNLRGGDIDLLVELSQTNPDRWALAVRLGARIERQLGLTAWTPWLPARDCSYKPKPCSPRLSTCRPPMGACLQRP